MSELPERDRFLEMLSIPGQYAQDGINWLIEGVDYVTDQTNTWEAMGYSPEEIEQNKEALKYVFEHNVADVEILEDLHKKIEQYTNANVVPA